MPSRRARGGTGAPEHPIAEPLHRGALHLLRLVRREDAATGVSAARLSALSVLVFGGPCTLGQLAAAEQVSAPTMSRLVAELEVEGWLRRTPDPVDARVIRLSATAAARRLLHEGRARRLGALSTGLAALTARDRRALTAAIPALERLVQALRAPQSGSAPVSTRALAPRTATRRRRFD